MTFSLEQIKYDAHGLVPAIVQDASQQRSAYAGLYEQRILAAYDSNRRHLVLEPFPRGTVE